MNITYVRGNYSNTCQTHFISMSQNVKEPSICGMWGYKIKKCISLTIKICICLEIILHPTPLNFLTVKVTAVCTILVYVVLNYFFIIKVISNYAKNYIARPISNCATRTLKLASNRFNLICFSFHCRTGVMTVTERQLAITTLSGDNNKTTFQTIQLVNAGDTLVNRNWIGSNDLVDGFKRVIKFCGHF